LISRQEHEAWNLLMACQGQLRLAAARGHDIKILSEVLPAAEAGMVEALTLETKGSG
jgi:hypothetical protein